MTINNSLRTVLGGLVIAGMFLAGCSGAGTPMTKDGTEEPDPAPAEPAGTSWTQVRTGGGFPDHNGNTGQDLWGVAFGDGRFVAVGPRGTIVHSADGRSWQAAASTVTDRDLAGVAYGAGRFVAVSWSDGNDGRGVIVHSPDGRSWEMASEQATRLVDVAFGDGRFVAVGEGGFIVHSTDGRSWQVARAPDRPGELTSSRLVHVTYGNGRFVAVGWRKDGDDFSGFIVHSTDGRSWQETGTVPDDPLNGVAFGAGRFVAVSWIGPIFHSTDGSSWQETDAESTSGDLSAVSYSPEGFYAVGAEGRIVHSTDGRSWQTSRDRIEGEGSLFSVTYGIGRVVAVGQGSRITVVDETGIQHVAPDTPVLSPLHGVTWGAGSFVAVADCGAIEYSSNGVAWQEAIEIDECLYGVAWGNGRFVAVGWTGGFISSDGRSWARLPDIPTSREDRDKVLNEVTFGGGRFVAVGRSGTIFHSTVGPIGRSWQGTAGTVTDKWLGGVAFGGGRFVAVGDHGTILHSSDGVEWQHALSSDDTDDRLRGVTYGDGRFVAVGGRGTIVHSADGERWQRATVDSSSPDLYGVAWSGERFVAVGVNGTVIVSPPT